MSLQHRARNQLLVTMQRSPFSPRKSVLEHRRPPIGGLNSARLLGAPDAIKDAGHPHRLAALLAGCRTPYEVTPILETAGAGVGRSPRVRPVIVVCCDGHSKACAAMDVSGRILPTITGDLRICNAGFPDPPRCSVQAACSLWPTCRMTDEKLRANS